MKLSLKQNSGFSLIEILVSLIVLSIGLMGLAGLQIAGLKGTNDAHYRTEASLLMMDLADRIRANQEGAANGDYQTTTASGAATTVDCSTPLAIQCDAASCSGANLAAFDRYSIECGIKKLLPGGKLSVDCADNDCGQVSIGGEPVNKKHKITVSWQEAKKKNEDQSDRAYKTRSIDLTVIP